MLIPRLIGSFVRGGAAILTGVRSRWVGCGPDPRPRIYFSNHQSHGDFVLIWAVLPEPVRVLTRPVAAADYWGADPFRRFLINNVFRGVLVERGSAKDSAKEGNDPLVPLFEALDAGDSLIFFPEGTRNTGDEMLPFKSGLFHLARQRPDVELVPVFIENVGRVMPKGALVPVPLLCSVSFGAPVALAQDESKAAFLERARRAVMDLR